MLWWWYCVFLPWTLNQLKRKKYKLHFGRFLGKAFLNFLSCGCTIANLPSPPPYPLTFTWWRLTRRSFYRRLERPSQATATDLSSTDLNSDTRLQINSRFGYIGAVHSESMKILIFLTFFMENARSKKPNPKLQNTLVTNWKIKIAEEKVLNFGRFLVTLFFLTLLRISNSKFQHHGQPRTNFKPACSKVVILAQRGFDTPPGIVRK